MQKRIVRVTYGNTYKQSLYIAQRLSNLNIGKSVVENICVCFNYYIVQQLLVSLLMMGCVVKVSLDLN